MGRRGKEIGKRALGGFGELGWIARSAGGQWDLDARSKVCTPTLDLWGNDLIPEIDETIGGAYVIEQAMDDRVVTFTY